MAARHLAIALAWLEKSLRDWFAAIERYPRQLHELVEQGEYLDMKRREYSRLQADARTPMRPPRH